MDQLRGHVAGVGHRSQLSPELWPVLEIICGCTGCRLIARLTCEEQSSWMVTMLQCFVLLPSLHLQRQPLCFKGRMISRPHGGLMIVARL